ncbi:MAG TPA: hypothetical protein VGD09_11075 [Blastococcus sp.]
MTFDERPSGESARRLLIDVGSTGAPSGAHPTTATGSPRRCGGRLIDPLLKREPS